MRFCKECGNPIEIGAKFCVKCGTASIDNAVPEEMQIDSMPKVITKPIATHQKSSKKVLYVIIGILIILLCVVGGMLVASMKEDNKETVISEDIGMVEIVEIDEEDVPAWQEQYNSGMSCLSEGNYEKAVVAFEAVIKIEPKSVEAYVGLADAYIGMEDCDTAMRILQEAYDQLEDEVLLDKYTEVEEFVYSTDNPMVVKWSNLSTETLIRAALDRPTGDITQGELNKISQISITEDEVTFFTNGGELGTEVSGEISDLSDIGNFKNLDSLYISGGGDDIDFLEISSLSELTSLRSVQLNVGNITDISQLAELSDLEQLSLWGNNITDISPLVGLVNLTYLNLGENNITDISPLAGLLNLTYLNLENNDITDISSLSELKSLTNLQLSGNSITDILAVSELKDLTWLGFGVNNITDISAVSELKGLTLLYLYDNKITDISSVSELINLDSLYIQGNKITDISSLSGLMNLTNVDLSDNNIVDWSPVEHVETVNGRA